MVQLSVVDLDPLKPEDSGGQVFVTRFTSDLSPVTVGIPLTRMKLVSSQICLVLVVMSLSLSVALPLCFMCSEMLIYT